MRDKVTYKRLSLAEPLSKIIFAAKLTHCVQDYVCWSENGVCIVLDDGLSPIRRQTYM